MVSLALAVALYLAHLQPARGEGQAGYRYENYQEDNHRIRVETHSALFNMTITPHVAFKGEVVFDTISGATPDGAAPAVKYRYLTGDDIGLPGFVIPILGNTNNTAVPVTKLRDRRRAYSAALPVTFGRHTLTPQYSHSQEYDYISLGVALNYSLELNQKNTVLNFGWAHTADRVRDDFFIWRRKNSDDYFIGISQLLGPKTVFAANFTYGNSRGYMNDPYRFIVAANFPQLDADNAAGFAERRPERRDRYIGLVSLTQFITPLYASVEFSYRFFHDTFGVDAHTLELAWHQKIGRHIVISPRFRYYRQGAADFYYEMLPDFKNRPQFFSSDYRLSEFESTTYGINLSWLVAKWITFDATFKRYIMHGLDGVTSQTAYPAANIVTIGTRLWF